jgi:hypothetical protein
LATIWQQLVVLWEQKFPLARDYKYHFDMRDLSLILSSFTFSLLIGGCATRVDGVQPDAGSAIDATNECTGTATRCLGSAYQRCTSGVFQTEQTCGGICSESMGCIACDPSLGATTCASNNVVTCNPDGSLGPVIQACAEGFACNGTTPACEKSCTADGVDLVYVVDENNGLRSFDPRKLAAGQEPFTLIGTLNCQPQLPSVPGRDGEPVTPFSMAVDRDAVAWVMYTSGEIFKVSTQDASCQASPYTARQNNLLLFGMGFVTDAAGGMTEKLYAGGGRADTSPMGQLAVIDVKQAAPAPTILGTLTAAAEQAPELTGTGDAKLYGFFPGLNKAFVQEVNRTNGAATGQEYLIPGGLGGQTRAWAFAHWGAKFYIFVTTAVGGVTNSTVRVIDKANGGYTLALERLPYLIVGAGVSTCAPTVIE